MGAIWLAIKEAATSKKFVAAVAGSVTAAALKIGLDLPTEDVALVLSPIITYILGQGWADRGKEAAKVSAIASVNAGGSMGEVRQIEAIKNA